MKITYDSEVDALSIRFRDGTMTSKHPSEGVALDYDAEGHLTGIEILDAKRLIGNADAFREVVLVDLALNQPS